MRVPADPDIEPRVWWRFIDDIFVIWSHREQALCHFIDSLNHHYPTIKFTATWSAKQVTFLDTTVYLKDGQISTNLYTKPTDKHQYFHIDSSHLFHCKASIPYSQALRLWWSWSEEENLHKKRTRKLKQHFLQSGYDEHNLTITLWRALHITRETCLQMKQNWDKPVHIPLVVTYHPILPSFHLPTKRHLPILHASDRIQEAFLLPALIAFHCLRNLRGLLVRSVLTSTPCELPGKLSLWSTQL